MKSFLLRTSHSLSVLSLLPLTSRRLSADQATCGVCTRRGQAHVGSRRREASTLADLHRHSQVVLVANNTDWRARLAWYTGPTCPRKVAMNVPLTPSQSFTAQWQAHGKRANFFGKRRTAHGKRDAMAATSDVLSTKRKPGHSLLCSGTPDLSNDALAIQRPSGEKVTCIS